MQYLPSNLFFQWSMAECRSVNNLPFLLGKLCAGPSSIRASGCTLYYGIITWKSISAIAENKLIYQPLKRDYVSILKCMSTLLLTRYSLGSAGSFYTGFCRTGTSNKMIRYSVTKELKTLSVYFDVEEVKERRK